MTSSDSVKLVMTALLPVVLSYEALEQTLESLGLAQKLQESRTSFGLACEPLQPSASAATLDMGLTEISYLAYFIGHCVFCALGLLRDRYAQIEEMPGDAQEAALSTFLAAVQRSFRLRGLSSSTPELYNPIPAEMEESLRTARSAHLRRLFETELLRRVSNGVEQVEFVEHLVLFSRPLAMLVWAGSYLVFETMGSSFTLCAYALFQALHMVSVTESRKAHKAVRLSVAAADALNVVEPHSEVLSRLEEGLVNAHEFLPRDDGREANLWRLRNRAMLLAQATADFLVAVADNVSAPLLTYPSTFATDVLGHCLELGQVSQRLGGRRYDLQPPGAPVSVRASPSSPRGARAEASAGHRFMLEQMKLPVSALHMPALTATQQKWEQWFDKLKGLLHQFDMTEATIIYYVTGHLESTHQLMVGWDGILAECKEAGKAVTLQQFFSHVRKRLFVSSGTRQEALLALLALCKKPHTCVDCKALRVELQTLFARLFPSPCSESVELEPISWYHACLKVQGMLSLLHQTPISQRKSVLVRAWAAYTFDSAKVYRQFLAPSLHIEATQASLDLCKSYLQNVYDQLTEAHEMHVTVHRGPDGDPQQVLSLAAEQLGLPSAQQLTQAVAAARNGGTSNDRESSVTGAKRRRAGSQHRPGPVPAARLYYRNARTMAIQPPPRQQPRPQRSGRGPAQRVTPRFPERPARQAPRPGGAGLSDQNYLREANAPERYALSAICAANGIAHDLDRCLEMARRGSCVLCGQRMHHSLLECPRCTQPEATRRVMDGRRRWANMVRRLGLHAALQEERSPMRVTAVPPRTA